MSKAKTIVLRGDTAGELWQLLRDLPENAPVLLEHRGQPYEVAFDRVATVSRDGAERTAGVLWVLNDYVTNREGNRESRMKTLCGWVDVNGNKRKQCSQPRSPGRRYCAGHAKQADTLYKSDNPRVTAFLKADELNDDVKSLRPA